MSGTTHPRLVILDVNETLSDMAPMAAAISDVGAPGEAARTWFAITLRDGFALTATGQNPGFVELAKDSLRFVLTPYVEERQLESAVASVMTAFGALRFHHDVVDGLRDLHEAGIRLVTLSNGPTSVAATLLEQAGAADLVEELLTVEDAPAWKPDPRAYRYALEHTGVSAEEAMLVAAHPWDVDGAARAGLRTAWVNRSATTYPGSFLPADVEVPTLADLPMALTAG